MWRFFDLLLIFVMKVFVKTFCFKTPDELCRWSLLILLLVLLILEHIYLIYLKLFLSEIFLKTELLLLLKITALLLLVIFGKMFSVKIRRYYMARILWQFWISRGLEYGRTWFEQNLSRGGRSCLMSPMVWRMVLPIEELSIWIFVHYFRWDSSVYIMHVGGSLSLTVCHGSLRIMITKL